MAIVAKTVLVFASTEDRERIRLEVPWLNFLQIVDDGSHADFTVFGTDAPITDPSQFTPDLLTVTRKWKDKKNAQDYYDWMSAQFSKLGMTPVSFTIEDYTE
jgi:hypothetical protein